MTFPDLSITRTSYYRVGSVTGDLTNWFYLIVDFDKDIGSRFGFMTWETFPLKNIDEGVATHVFASFDKSLTGK